MTPDNGRGGSRAFPTELRGHPSPEWNHYRITCNDGVVTLEVNGKKVTSGRNASPCRGYLCLESEGGIVHYRNMRIRTLPDTPIEDEDTAVSNRGYQSIYTGLNLSGWRTDETALSNETESHGWTVNDWKLCHSGPSTQLHSSPLSGQTGVLLDVRRTDDNASAEILLENNNRTTELASLASGSATAHMNQKLNQWNRVECDWKGGTLQLTVNGTSVAVADSIDHTSPDSSLVLRGTGTLEFTNLFAR